MLDEAIEQLPTEKISSINNKIEFIIKQLDFHTNLETPLIGIIAPGFEDVIPDLESYRWDSIGYANSSYSNYTDI